MRFYTITILSCLCFPFLLNAQSYRFHFGSGKSIANYTSVTPDTKFTYQTGYGFSQGSVVTAVDRQSKNQLSGSFVTSKQPFYFSVLLPDGNYDVKLLLGDAGGISATTVKAENRRLVLPQVITRKGELVTRSFTVHVRDSLIRDGGGNTVAKVKLKPRESAYLHWDNMLTLEFNDSLPKLSAIEITPNTKATTVFLAGNSTVVDQDKEPWAAWGQIFPSFFEPGKLAIANYAESGETLKAFKGERRLEKIMSLAKPGDYLFIEFAHNDQKPGGTHLDPFTTYQSTLQEWIEAARKKQMIPVLVTSMHRRSFDSAGHIINTLSDFPEAMRQLAAQEHTALIDLNAMSKQLYEAWGPVSSVKAFVHYPAHSFPGQEIALKDDTHFSTYGAYELARCVLKGVFDAKLGIVSEVKKGTLIFNPALPDAFEKWYWPLSPLAVSQKPDGN